MFATLSVVYDIRKHSILGYSYTLVYVLFKNFQIFGFLVVMNDFGDASHTCIVHSSYPLKH